MKKLSRHVSQESFDDSHRLQFAVHSSHEFPAPEFGFLVPSGHDK